ncbi:MAG: Ig-like domain-containing protein [Opitutales bacterium]
MKALPDCYLLLIFTASLIPASLWAEEPLQIVFDAGQYGAIVDGEKVQLVAPGAAADPPTVAVELGWRFTGWSESFDRVSTDLRIEANYVQEPLTDPEALPLAPSIYIDTDGNGWSDAYESFYGFNGDNLDELSDLDGDGLSNREEELWGTNLFKTKPPMRIPGGLTSSRVLVWGVRGKGYEVLASSNLSSWGPLCSFLGDDQWRLVRIPSESPTFIRLRPFDLDSDGGGMTDYEERLRGEDPFTATEAEIHALLPIAEDDFAQTEAGQPLTLNPLGNDSAVTGGLLTLESVTGSQGTVEVTGDLVLYQPPANFTGIDAFSYSVLDAQGRRAEAQLSVQVDDSPAQSVPFGEGFAGSFFALNFTPDAFAGIDYSVPPLVSATFNAIDLGEQDFPESVPEDNFAARFEGWIDVRNSGTYTFMTKSDDGASLTVDGIILTLNEGPSAHGRTPDASVELEAGPHYVVLDYYEATGGQRVKLLWSGPDTYFEQTPVVSGPIDPNQARPPFARDDYVFTPQGESIQVNLLENDFDAELEQLTLVSIESSTLGTFTLLGGGMIRFEPYSDAFGISEVAYVVADESGMSTTGTLTVEVLPNDSTQLSEGLFAEFFVVNGNHPDELSDLPFDAEPVHRCVIPAVDFPSAPFFPFGSPNNFGAHITGMLYVKNAGSYTLQLERDDSATLRVNGKEIITEGGPRHVNVELVLERGLHPIEIYYFEGFKGESLGLRWSGPDTGGNLEIIDGDSLRRHNLLFARNDFLAATQGEAITFDLRANDDDFDGDGLTVTSVEGIKNGTFWFNDAGEFVYQGDPGFMGDERFSYTIADSFGNEAKGEGAIYVRSGFAPGLKATYIDSHGGRQTWADFDFNELFLSLQPEHQEVAPNLDYHLTGHPLYEGGSYGYFSARFEGFLTVSEGGLYEFNWEVGEGAGLYLNGELATLSSNHLGARDLVYLPAGVHHARVDFFSNGGPGRLILRWSGPDTGGVSEPISPDALHYAPAVGQLPPSAVQNTFDVVGNEAVLLDVLSNDSDLNNDPIELTSVTTPLFGQAWTTRFGPVRYEPPADFTGEDRFSYTVTDDQGNSATAEVIVQVRDPIEGLNAEFFVLDTPPQTLTDINFNAEPDHTITVYDMLFPFYDGRPDDLFAARYHGFLLIETGGTYQFELVSNDGSILWVNGEKVIDHDGIHSARHSKTATLELPAGRYPIEVRYFDEFQTEELRLRWRGPDTDGSNEHLGGSALQRY